MAEKKVKVKIMPLHNIGGVGTAGDEVMMAIEDADMYFRDGYVEYVYVDEAESGMQKAVISDQAIVVDATEEHVIMMPQAKRTGRVVRKK